MMNFRRQWWVGAGIAVLVGVVVVLTLGIVWQVVSASPSRQFPTDLVTVISDPPPADLPGQFSEATLLQADPLDPDLYWRLPAFDDSGWQPSYLAARLPAWGVPVGGAGLADFIWGGTPGAGYAPQFLFLRKNFCIPINARLDSAQAATPLRVQIAASPGDAFVTYNGAEITPGLLPGREDGSFHEVSLAAVVPSASRLGRNTLALSVQDDVADVYVAVAYHAIFNYAIDPGAITMYANPSSGAALPGVTMVNFWQNNTGLSGDAPYTFAWDLGNGTISTEASPSIVYAAAGVYTVTLTMTDRFGCPSAPVFIQYVVAAPTPTNTPVPVDTPTPTNTPVPTDTPAPTSTSAPHSHPQSQPQPTNVPTPTPVPTLIVPMLLPETGNTDHASLPVVTLFVVGGTLWVVVCFLLHRRRA